MQKKFDTIIIGGGAAGLMAAISASDGKKQVLLLEKMEQAGRKLRITGKGRCNLTNTAPIRDFIGHIGSDGRFLRNAFSVFFNRELMDFFEKHDVSLVEERGGRVFPKSGKSLDVFLGLMKTIEKDRNITVMKNTGVRKIVTFEDRVSGVQLDNGDLINATNVILATGGKSYPATGSTGDGLRFAMELGHTVETPYPSLVPLVCKEQIPAELDGFALKNVALKVMEESGKKICDFFGEMSFTNDGIAGPIVLSASRLCTRLLNEGMPLKVSIDLKPALSEETLDRKLLRDFDENGTRVLKDALRLWLPAEIIGLFLSDLKIEHYKRLNQINSAERKKILHHLKGLPLTLVATRGFEEAIVTQGGVSLKEVNPKTMESKIVRNLFVVGELLDLDADTGGYNLQIAFSTGYVAGKACIR